jgi:hypothetical protein
MMESAIPVSVIIRSVCIGHSELLVDLQAASCDLDKLATDVFRDSLATLHADDLPEFVHFFVHHSEAFVKAVVLAKLFDGPFGFGFDFFKECHLNGLGITGVNPARGTLNGPISVRSSSPTKIILLVIVARTSHSVTVPVT